MFVKNAHEVKSNVIIRLSCRLDQGADKYLARPGRKQAPKHVRTCAISTKPRRELSSSFFFQGKAPKEIHANLTETLACFRPGRAKDLSAPL